MIKIRYIRYLNRFANWRIKYIGDHTFLVLVAVVIGIVTSVLAVLLKKGVEFIREQVQHGIFLHDVDWMYLIYPVIGIFLCNLYVQFFLKGNLGRGTGRVLLDISRNNANVDKHKMHSQMISSLLTVGFGGSAGLEAPIVVTGSAHASRLGNALRMSFKEKSLLIACGAAAGISAIFNCPIAGVIFAMEVILIRATVPAFIPILMSSATSAVVSKMIYSGQPFFRITDEWMMNALPFYIVLGILCGLVSVYNIRLYSVCENIYGKFKNPYLATMICGSLLGVFIFILPPLYGEGYNTITDILHGNFNSLFVHSPFAGLSDYPWAILLVGSLLMLTKVFATSLTIGGGGNGGMFGSSLYAGGFLGLIFTEAMRLTGIANLNREHFIVIAMAGLLSGVIHAPLTAIFLIAEITGGYTLFVPLMIVTALSYFITRYFEPYSVYTRKLAKVGELVMNNPDYDVLNHIRLESLIERDFASVPLEGNLGNLVNAVADSKRNLFPVLDEEGELHGVIVLDNIRSLMFDTEKYDEMKIIDMMQRPPAMIHTSDSMSNVMQKFEDTEAWNLPVLKNGKYIGFVSKSNIFTRYRSQLIHDLAKE